MPYVTRWRESLNFGTVCMPKQLKTAENAQKSLHRRAQKARDC